jgi:hypothetical protein
MCRTFSTPAFLINRFQLRDFHIANADCIRAPECVPSMLGCMKVKLLYPT